MGGCKFLLSNLLTNQSENFMDKYCLKLHTIIYKREQIK